MSTEEVAKAALEYPFLIDVFASNDFSFENAANTILKQSDALQELFMRQNGILSVLTLAQNQLEKSSDTIMNLKVSALCIIIANTRLMQQLFSAKLELLESYLP